MLITARLLVPITCMCAAVGACGTVEPGQRGIVFRPYNRAEPVAMLTTGSYAKAPWNDLVVYDLRWRTGTEKADVQTKDKLHLIVPTAVVYRPKADRIVAIHQTLGPAFYESTVRPALLTAVRTEFAHREHEVVVPKAAELQADILKDLQEKLSRYDIEVASVTFQDLDYPPDLAKAILESMVTEQEIKNKDAQLTLVRREQEIASARARGEAESRLGAKEAEAKIAVRDAEIALTRSRAEAEAIKIRGSHVSPMYLRLRQIEAQEALGKSPNAKLYFVPVGKGGVPIALHPEDRP